MARLNYPTNTGVCSMNVDMPVAIGERIMVGQVAHRIIDERNGQFYMERITDRSSIVDQMRPLQEDYLQEWATHSGVVFYGSGIRQEASRYTAAVDPISCSADSPAIYNVNGVDIAALPNGDRDFAAESRAQSPHNAMTYRPSGFTMQDLDEMAARIQARARPDTAGNPEQVLARYGHLLTPADQQQLGYVAPPPTPVDGQQVHTLSYPGVRLGDAPPTQHERMNAIMAHTFGERIAPAKIKGPKPVANFLASTPGPTAQELAAADEWLKNSPWG